MLAPLLLSRNNISVLHLNSYSSTAVSLHPTYEHQPNLIICYRLAVQVHSYSLLYLPVVHAFPRLQCQPCPGPRQLSPVAWLSRATSEAFQGKVKAQGITIITRQQRRALGWLTG